MYLVFQGHAHTDANGCRTTEVMVNGQPLEPELSLKLRNHSPTGFEWGYGGSGPAQLALAILLWVLIAPEALQLYQLFKFQVIGGLNRDHWIMADHDVRTWAQAQQPLLDFRYKTEVLEVLDELTDDELLQPPEKSATK
jgi:hypothetical protein